MENYILGIVLKINVLYNIIMIIKLDALGRALKG